jgi:hypothetical protein
MKVLKWNEDKKHRCPECHAVTIDTQKPSKWKVYQCCRCGTVFCARPRLADLLPFAGVVCSEHAFDLDDFIEVFRPEEKESGSS